jgi:hypothetical protein
LLLSFEEMQMQKCTQASSFFSLGKKKGKKIGVDMKA